jgi:hypothetical protein
MVILSQLPCGKQGSSGSTALWVRNRLKGIEYIICVNSVWKCVCSSRNASGSLDMSHEAVLPVTVGQDERGM